jgi:type I site-specific restriction endonuclease
MIFAKDDNHAEEIVKIVREVFAREMTSPRT